MDQSHVVSVMQDALTTIMVVSAPALIIGMLVGVIISIFQATTQINEQTLSFVPKIVAIFVSLIIFGGWMLTRMTDFTTRLFEYVQSISGLV